MASAWRPSRRSSPRMPRSDLTLVKMVVDAGVSAKTLQRPGLQRALGMLRGGQANALLVCKLDRLTRSVKDLGTLVEAYFSSDKISLLSVADSIDARTAAGRLVLNVFGSVAQWEREAIGERTAEALAHKKTKGEKTGGDVPYGYRLAEDSKTLVPDDAEQKLLRLSAMPNTVACLCGLSWWNWQPRASPPAKGQLYKSHRSPSSTSWWHRGWNGQRRGGC